MATLFALVFGAVYVLVGLVGFVYNPIGGYFLVNPVHDGLHLFVGALWLASLPQPFGPNTSRSVSRALGVFFILLSLGGFVFSEIASDVLSINLADDFLHLGTGVVALAIGFLTPAR